MAQGNLALAAAAGVLGVLLSVNARAMDWRPDAVEFQGGGGRDGLGVASAGLVWEWEAPRMRAWGLTGQTELVVSQWNAHGLGGGYQGLQQLALVPMLRMELDHGRSPWVLELGIGLSWLSRQYETPEKKFSSTWNFYDVIGAAYRFGADEEHEVGLRLTHVSNAGLKVPNPGEEFVQLRYARQF